ncbi:MAG: hypothetical protein V7629_18310 [Motiliproteus sp.]
MTDFWRYSVALVGVGSLFLGLLSWLVVVTAAFKRIEEVERQIATPGKQLDMIRNVYREGPIGRWMRAMHVFNFFIFRKIPRYGSAISSRIGDEITPIPKALKIWVILPVGLASLFGTIFLMMSVVLMFFNQ